MTKKPHLFHHSTFVIAEIDQRPVAALSGYDPAALGYHALQGALPEVFGKMGLTEQMVEPDDNAKKVLACIPEPVPGAWMINNVATLPEFRGRGLTSQLLKEIMRKGRRQGHTYAQINVYIGNSAAIRVYERLGFREIDRKKDPIFEEEIGSPGMARLIRDL
jgi:ribosomal protein S18 acetylase RimI-like enzyme